MKAAAIFIQTIPDQVKTMVLNGKTLRTFRTALVIIFFFFELTVVCGQSIELTAFSGYTFGHSFDIKGGSAKIGAGHTFGGILEIPVAENLNIGLIYSRQQSLVTAQSTELPDYFRSDAAITYILAGAGRTMEAVPEKVLFYGGLKGGVGIISSRDDQFNSKTYFSVSGSLGTKYFINEKIGLRIGMNIYFPVVNAGANIWWGIGNGPQVGISGWSPIVQFNLLGGLVIKLN